MHVVKPIEPGDMFNKWTVLSFSHYAKSRNKLYNCQCECGREQIVYDSSLRHNKSTQCLSCSNKANGRKGLDAMAKEHLYFIRCGEYVKIGSTDNLKRRTTDIQGCNPTQIKLEHFVLGGGSREPEMHKTLSKHHHAGEWFHLPDKQAYLDAL